MLYIKKNGLIPLGALRLIFDININEIFLPFQQLEVLEKNYHENLILMKKLKKLKKELNDNDNNSGTILHIKCIKCKKYILNNILILICMHYYCMECLEDIKTAKNCIFKCIKKRSNKKDNIFRQDNEYFIKSLEENLSLRSHLISKKANIVKLNTNNQKIENRFKMLQEDKIELDCNGINALENSFFVDNDENILIRFKEIIEKDFDKELATSFELV